MRYCVTIDLDLDVPDSTSDAQLGRAIRTVLDQPLTASIALERWYRDDAPSEDIPVPATTMPCTTSLSAAALTTMEH